MPRSFSLSNKIHLNIFVVLLFILLCPINSYAAQDTQSVVKIFVTSNSVDYYRPWQSRGIQNSSGSGAIIDGNKIITNAHVVSDATFIQVKKNGDPKKYIAHIAAIGHDCDLALLSVENEEFFNDTSPIEFGGLPNLQDDVTVLGYPMGGEKISITEGVVSRIELTSYSQSGRKLLAVQIDAAINSGNSGGPIVKNNKMVGVAMQVFQSGQNIGYMIPMPIVKHFLKDLDDETYDGFPILGISFDNTENTNLRKLLNVEEMTGGVVVNRVLPYSAAEERILEGDVIIEVEGTKIGEDGTFKFRGDERLGFPHLITKKQNGENVALKIVRNGKVENINITLKLFKPLVAYSHYYEKPPYFIFGGLVFTVLSSDLLRSWGNRWWEKSPLNYGYYLMGDGRMNLDKRRDIVVMLSVIPDDVNVGYHNYGNDIIRKVNGRPFDSLEEFIGLIIKSKAAEKYTIFETSDLSKIVILNQDIDQVNERILERNNIPRQYSDDVGTWIKNANQPL